MKFRVTVTAPAEQDIHTNHRWWSENRSPEEAGRWFLGVNAAVKSLKRMPERHGYADEAPLKRAGVRQMGFGLGGRPTHRIVYTVIEDEVIVYRVRAGRQDKLRLSDLAGD